MNFFYFIAENKNGGKYFSKRCLSMVNFPRRNIHLREEGTLNNSQRRKAGMAGEYLSLKKKEYMTHRYIDNARCKAKRRQLLLQLQ
jgi:hypothetical protein